MRTLFLIWILSYVLIVPTRGFNDDTLNLKSHPEVLEYDPYMYSQVKSVNISGPYETQPPGSWFKMDVVVEVWNPMLEDIFLNLSRPFVDFDPDKVYSCGLAFEINSDPKYDFSLWSHLPFIPPSCLLAFDLIAKPGVKTMVLELRGLDYGNKRDSFVGNLSVSLIFTDHNLVQQNADFEKFYNLTAEITEENIKIQTDAIPEDWGAFNSSLGLQMRVVSVGRTYHSYDKGLWSLPIHMESEVVGSGKGTTGCVELLSPRVSAELIINRSSNEVKHYYNGLEFCSPLVTEHEIEEGIKISNIKLNIDFNSTYIPPGIYTFNYAIGSPNVIKYKIEIMNDEYFKSYYSENHNLIYSERVETNYRSIESRSTFTINSIMLMWIFIFWLGKKFRSG